MSPSIETRIIDHGFFKGYSPRPRAFTKELIIHCSATPSSWEGGAKEIHSWHRKRGWSGIGYNYVITRDGAIERGRPEHMAGAHAAGYNATSIGVCLVGGVERVKDRDGKDDIDGPQWDMVPANNFTVEQMETLKDLVRALSEKYPGARVVGHGKLPGVRKACPSFDVDAWWKEAGRCAEND